MVQHIPPKIIKSIGQVNTEYQEALQQCKAFYDPQKHIVKLLDAIGEAWDFMVLLKPDYFVEDATCFMIWYAHDEQHKAQIRDKFIQDMFGGQNPDTPDIFIRSRKNV